MQTVEQAYNVAADLYSLAFLLTNCSELSLEVTLEILDGEDETELFFLPSARTHLRKKAVAKALTAVCDELALSVCQTAFQQLAAVDLPPSNWSLDPSTSKLQIDSASLSIEIFPRCALLLTMFEGFSLEDASALLSSDADLVLKGRTIALWDLTRRLARMQGWRWTSTTAYPSSLAFCESNSTPLMSEPKDFIEGLSRRQISSN